VVGGAGADGSGRGPAAAGTVFIGAHVNSETAQHYGYVKDWPASAWEELFACFRSPPVCWLLFGNAATGEFVETEIRGPMTDADAIAAEAVARLKADGALRLLGTG
jgi:hypothetical protein